MTVHDLWPRGIGRKVLSPVAILKAQAAYLDRRTGGLVKARVAAINNGDDKERYEFSIYSDVAQYQEPILLFEHDPEKPYPLTLFSSHLAWDAVTLASGIETSEEPGESAWCKCWNQEDFTRMIERILAAGSVHAIVDSIMSRIDEVEPELESEAEL